MIKLMFIAGIGGFVGTALRFLVGHAAKAIHPAAVMPWGTLVVNIAGCLVIGILYGLFEQRHLLSPTANALLITGFCGGFTTFSTFADDIYLMMAQRHWLCFAAYLSASVVIGVMMVMLGRYIVARL